MVGSGSLQTDCAVQSPRLDRLVRRPDKNDKAERISKSMNKVQLDRAKKDYWWFKSVKIKL